MIRLPLLGLLCALLLPQVTHADVNEQFQRAVSLSKQGDWQQAAELLRQLASEQPDRPEPKNNLAVALLKLGQVEQARQTLEQAVTSQASFKIAQENRQKLYDHLAAQAYEKALGNSSSRNLPSLQLLDKIQPSNAQSESQATSEKSLQQVETSIREQLNIWSSAWSSADADTYLACYSARFRPFDQAIDHQQWRYQRRIRLSTSKNVDVSLDKIKVFLDQQSNTALVEFIQSYRSANYNDKVVKQLLLSLERKQWLITSERVLKLL